MCCCSPGEGVVASERLAGPSLRGQLLRKGQRRAPQPGHALPQRGIAPLAVIGGAGQRAERPVLRRRHHPCLDDILIGRKRGVWPVRQRPLGPQAPGTRAAAIPPMKGTRLARLGIHGQPKPWLMRLLLDHAGHCIGFPSRRRILTSPCQVTGWTCTYAGSASQQVTRKPQSHVRPTPTARHIPRSEMRSRNKRSSRARVSSEMRYWSAHWINWRLQSLHRLASMTGSARPGRCGCATLPIVNDVRDLHTTEKRCAVCGEAFRPFPAPAASALLAVQVRAHVRRIQRQCSHQECRGPHVPGMVTAPPAPQLIPKSP
jgi:hypothetical protein